jgi:predicted HTH domain antitoxin
VGGALPMILKLPDLNLLEHELKLTLAEALLERRTVSLGKAAEIAGFSAMGNQRIAWKT